MEKPEINIVWFKRDLRFTDHEPLFNARQSGLPLVLLYIFEPTVMAYHDSDVRHWRFVHESLKEMNSKLEALNAKIWVFHNEAQTVFEALIENYSINTVFSSQEIGNGLTFDRDKSIKTLFDCHQIAWNEYQTNGIIRGLKNRNHWEKLWEASMTTPPKIIAEENWNFSTLAPELWEYLKGPELPIEITTRNKNFQEGGEYWAWRYLESFIK